MKRACLVAAAVLAVACKRADPGGAAGGASSAEPPRPPVAPSGGDTLVGQLETGPTISGVVLSKDGSRLVVGNELRHATTGAVLATLPRSDGAVLSPSGEVVLSRGTVDGELTQFHVTAAGKPGFAVAAKAAMLVGDTALVAATGKELVLRSVDAKAPVVLDGAGNCRHAFAGRVRSGCALLVEGTRIVAADAAFARVYDATGKELGRVEVTADDEHVALVGDVIALCGKSVRLRRLAKPADAKTVPLDGIAARCEAAGASLLVEAKGQILVIDPEAGAVKVALNERYAGRPFVVSPDGTHADTGAGLIDLRAGKRLPGSGPSPGRFSPDGRLLATERESSVAVVDAETGRVRIELAGSLTPFRREHGPWVDAARVATVQGNELSIWDTTTGTRVRVPLAWNAAGTDRYGAVQVSPKLVTFFASGSGEPVRVVLARLDDLGAVTLSRAGGDGLRVEDVSGKPATLEDLLTGKSLPGLGG